MDVPQKVKTRTAILFSSWTSWYLPNEIKSTNSKRYMHVNVHRSVIYNSQDMKTT